MTEKNRKRALPSRFVLAVTVGGVIGLGILRGPGEITEVVTDSTMYLALWLFAGLFVLLSTAVSVELVGITPRSGGFYSLIRRAYGPYSGFVIGWADWLTYATDLAIKAVVIMEFVAILLPESAEWTIPLAIAATTAFAAVQLRGIELGALIQESATSLIGFFIFTMAMLLFFVGTVDRPTTVPDPDNSLNDWSMLIATIIFTYDGWLYASYFSGEIRGGTSAVARSCIKGMVVVIALYMLLNLALVKSVGLAALAGNDLALARALELAVHPAAGTIIVVAAIIILLSHLNLEYMTGPRILQALAEDGLAARHAQDVGKGGNPIFAVLFTWFVSVLLILLGGFKFLLLFSVFLFIPLYLALIVGILILRETEPDTDRPIKAWGHPYSTFFCLVAWSVITIFQAYVERETALYAVAAVAISWPAYLYLSRRATN
ncbi:MAG: APC family permease [Woeseiaceae bacterium]|nr:APC family permease [Woeseiaceae bacterium]